MTNNAADIARAPPGSRCLYCGCDVTGTYVRKCIFTPAPEKGLGRIKFAGIGWSCDDCQKPSGNLVQREDVVNEYLKEDIKMFQITVTLQAPELASAICALAGAISGQPKRMEINTISPALTPAISPAPTPAPVTPGPVPMQTPIIPGPVQAPPVGAAPIAPPAAVPVAQPAQAPVLPGMPAPTTAQTYTMEQLAVAATQLVDAGRRNDLVSLLASFGVQALTQLPKEHYGVFATQLRAMGAKI